MPKQPTKAELLEALQEQSQINESLSERILELEDRDYEWSRINIEAEFEFSRSFLNDLIRHSRLMFIKNPLINRAITVQAHYVFGQNVEVSSDNDNVNAVIQRFWSDPANRQILTSQQSAVDLEEELANTGNLFLVLFTHPQTGRVVLRTIPAEEISEIVCNPQDNKEPWFYKREWTHNEFDSLSGLTRPVFQTDYYPAWNYNPPNNRRPTAINGKPVHWEAPVYHMRVGATGTMKFGIPEAYAAFDWAKAVKNDLEDYASQKRSLAIFSWKLRTGGGSRGVQALKTKMQSTLFDGSGSGETNPAPTAGSMAMFGNSADLEPIKTAGMTPHPDEGRRMWLMVSAATGIPETILAGDADVGNLATAKTLDRPTELKMRSRQEHWKASIEDILGYVIVRAIIAGQLDGMLRVDEFTGQQMPVLRDDDQFHVDVDFPSILNRDILEWIQAIIAAATLDGKMPANTMTAETLSRQLLNALGVDDPDEEIAQLGDMTPPEATLTSEARYSGALKELQAILAEARNGKEH